MAEVAQNYPEASIFLVNGHTVSQDTPLHENDECWCLSPDGATSRQEFQELLSLRHSPEIQAIFNRATVGIMGLGGLGSVVAMTLARMGIGHLCLADFDVVDPANLNRQYYFYDQVGLAKTEAMAANLSRVNPFLELTLINEKLDSGSIKQHFSQVDVLVECFDDPAMKAEAFRLALTDLKPIRYVGASGVAGYGPNNTIQTSQPYDGVYLVGDGSSAAGPGSTLMASRVGIAAHQQANQAIRILIVDATSKAEDEI